MNEFLTPEAEVTIVEDPNEGTPTEETKAEGTEQEPVSPEKEVDYKVKFAESSKEAQRLYEENKRLQADLSSVGERAKELETITQQEQTILKEENPEGYKLLQLEKSLKKMQDVVLTQSEERAIDAFIKANPEAEAHRDAIKKLGRVDGDKSYDSIWTDYFKPAYEKSKQNAVAEIEQQRKHQAETGKGNASGEPVVELFSQAFNKLPLDKRKEALKKAGF